MLSGTATAPILTAAQKTVTNSIPSGRQMRILGESVKARYLEKQKIEHQFPDEGYQGEYIYDIANNLAKEFKGDLIDNNNIIKKISGKDANTSPIL